VQTQQPKSATALALLRPALHIILIALLALSPACKKQEAAPEDLQPPADNVYRLSLTDNPRTLDPAHFTGVDSEGVARRIFNGLVKFDSHLNIVPDLAQSWQISEDGRVYTFHLRKGVRFHNGRELTADDVRFSCERLLRKETASHRAWVVAAVAGAAALRSGRADSLAGLATPDKYTVVFTLEEPFAPFLSHLAMAHASIVPKEEIEKPGPPFGRRPVGTGPFRFKRWDDNNVIELTRNDDYFLGPASLSGIRFRIIKEPIVAYQEYCAGNLEHCAVPEGYYEKIVSGPRKNQLRVTPTLSTYYLGIMMSRSPLGRNAHLRRALNYAIDREYLCRKILGASHTPAKGLIPPGLPSYNRSLAGYAFDPERAKLELRKAGFGPSNPPPVFTFYFRSKPPTPRIAQAIQADLKRAGIRVELHPRDLGALKDAVNKAKPDLFYLSWIADFPDADNFLQLFNSARQGPAGNRVRYANPVVDALLAEVRKTADPQARILLYRKIEQQIVNDSPWVFISHKQTQLLLKPYVRNFHLTAMDVGASVNLVDFHKVSFRRSKNP